MNSLWQINVVDVEQTLTSVVDALLGDRTAPKATTTARAKALQKMGRVFQGAKPNLRSEVPLGAGLGAAATSPQQAAAGPAPQPASAPRQPYPTQQVHPQGHTNPYPTYPTPQPHSQPSPHGYAQPYVPHPLHPTPPPTQQQYQQQQRGSSPAGPVPVPLSDVPDFEQMSAADLRSYLKARGVDVAKVGGDDKGEMARRAREVYFAGRRKDIHREDRF
eukprot:jgi/Chlat1/3555/Chrsp234S03588